MSKGFIEVLISILVGGGLVYFQVRPLSFQGGLDRPPQNSTILSFLCEEQSSVKRHQNSKGPRDRRHKVGSGTPKGKSDQEIQDKTAFCHDFSGNAAAAQEIAARRSSRIANIESRLTNTAE